MKSDEEQDNEYHSEFDLSSVEAPSLLGHAWIQRGMELSCQSCQREHGIYLRPGYMYQGNDERGKPVIKKVW